MGRLKIQSAQISFFAVHHALVARAQSLLPPKYDGLVYTKHRVHLSTIVIEAFSDPVCPDSRDAWEPLTQAVDYYGPRVWFVVVLLP
ncbi:hypothetical protein EUGRSUZ_H01097 [Eucalyptus grandis]|uniref:Uncharacterized protein n=2 Tax=Eucalyptus grandis TaxID=71139 RepID=A0ACC3JN17_EUCGR|nr:hypothetical protein EUGRSUZ_H01097 [Eucalyptus grandis]